MPTPSKVGIAAERLRDFESEEIDWEGSVTYYVRDAGGKVLAVYKRGLHVPTDEDDCWPQDFSLTPFNDQDGDGVDDASTPNPSLPGPPPGQTQRDNCPPMPTPPVVPYGMPINPWQEDSDADGIGDACDPYPLDPSRPMGALAGGKSLYIRAPYRAWIESSDHVDIKLAELHIYGNAAQGRIAMYRPKTKRNTEYIESFAGDGGVFVRTLQRKEYEMKDHLGNVRLVISDLKEVVTAGSERMVDVQSTNEYYPFGMLQPERHYQAKDYRYGFNGKEMDNEVAENGVAGESGLGNHCDYGVRVYNPAIAKFLSVDPISSDFPWNSPYAFAENRVLDGIDAEGLEYISTHTIRGLMAEMSALEKSTNDRVKKRAAKNMAKALAQLLEVLQEKGDIHYYNNQFYYKLDRHMDWVYSDGKHCRSLTEWIYNVTPVPVSKKGYVGCHQDGAGDCFVACQQTVGNVGRKIGGMMIMVFKWCREVKVNLLVAILGLRV